MQKSNLLFGILISILLLSSLAFGWQYAKDLGGGLDDGRSIDMCADGGVFLAGRSNAWAEGGFAANWYDHEMFLVKLDSMGTEEWIHHYGQNGEGFYDAAWCVCATPDSGAILCGKTQSPKWVDVPYGYTTYYDDVLVVRVDKNGDTLWTRGYGGNRFDRAWWIKDIPGSSDFFIAGPCASFGPDMPSTDYENLWIMRIDSVGNVLAEGLWSDSTRDGHSDVRWGDNTPDGGCVLIGSTDLRDTSYYYAPYDSIVTHRISRIVLIKVDSLCNIEWSKVYDRGLSDHYPRAITRCRDYGYMMICYDKWPAWTLAIRLDDNGDTLWSGYIGLDLSDPSTRLANFMMVIKDAGTGFYFAGSGQGWGWVIRTDANLNEVWRVPANFGSASEVFQSCVLTSDGGCCAVGYTYSLPPTAYSDLFAMRVTRFGGDYTGVSEQLSAKPDKININAYPNPFNSSCKLDLSSFIGIEGLEIFDISGRLVDEIPIEMGKSVIWKPKEELPSGVYLIRVAGSSSAGCRVVLMK